ncbi:MAG TPA: hypothetical protein VGD62_05060 [Acidobacteriaceae bacterium]
MTFLERGTEQVARFSNLLSGTALLLLLTYLLWLPTFPSGDGPLHIYFANILWSLARHQPGYAPYYAIRHLIAPYSLHYFALIFFEKFLSSANAEKLFVTMVVLNTALGFRFLARRLGDHAALASLWMVPLLLTWSMGGGLLNFSFAIGVAYWAFAFWTMLHPAGSPRALAGFVVALAVLVLSHPVPLLVLCAFVGADLLLVWLEARRFGRPMQGLGVRAVAFALSCLAMVVPTLLADKGKVNAIWPDLHPHVDLLIELVRAQCVGLFGGAGVLQVIYTLGLLAIVPGALLLVGRGMLPHLRAGASTPAERLLVIAVVYLLATLSFPHSLNGSYYFPQRMWDLLWPLILACAAAASLGPRLERGLALVGAALVLVFAVLTVQTLGPAARKEAALGQVHFEAGSRGLFVQPLSATHPYAGGFTYPVFFWSGARAVANSHAILLNSPWLDLSILPVKENGQAGLLVDEQSKATTEHPWDLLQVLETPSAARDRALAHADFLLYGDPIATRPDVHAPVAAMLADRQMLWTCSYSDFYAACTRNPGPAARP